ncbi:SusC/RagA family TonB-linked outer membrane protein, partial [Parabacteroides distasonis]
FNYAPNQFPLRFSDGTFSEYRLYNGGTGNPYNMLNESGYTDGWYANLQSKLTLTQKLDFITEGLNIKLSGSFDADYNSKTKRTKTPTSYMMQLNDAGEKEYIQINEGAPNLTDHSEASKGGEKRVYLEASLNYKRIFNNVHDVSGLLLYMQKERQTQGSGLPYKKQSIVARGSYGYDNRYMLEGSFGLTGSENFAEGHRYGIFPAVGIAWYASNEKFMKGTEDIINKLKIRASYGITGNDNVGGTRFPYRGSLKTDAGGYNFGFNVGANGGGTNDQGKGIIENLFAAPFLSWEIEEKKNIGFDLGLLRGRIDMSVDFFKNDRRDILMQRKTVSAVTGFRQSPWQNFGKVTNKGLDGNIVVKQSINNVNLSFRGNFTYAKNKIMEYDEVSPRYEYQRYTGQSLKTPLLYIADGLYTADDFIITENPENGSKSYSLKEGLPVPSAAVSPGDIKYLDLNGDGKIDSYDQTYNHKFYAENPELVYGFGLNAEYKGFYAGIFFQGVAKASMNLNGSRDFVPFSFGQLGSLRREGFDHWSSRNPENQDVLFPRLHTEEFSHNKLNSTWWYRDASFLRLKNIELGYTFNKEMLRKMAIQNARIYVQGNNIAVWDHIGMWDPELGSAGSGIKYPINMTWTLGVEFGF